MSNVLTREISIQIMQEEWGISRQEATIIEDESRELVEEMEAGKPYD